MLDDIKDIFGKKGFLILLVGAGALFLISLLSKQETGGGELVEAVGYAGYPDAVTNANVIIDSINEYNDFNTGQILDAIDQNNSYFTDSLNKVQDNILTEFDQVDNSFEELLGTVDGIKNDTTQLINKPSTVVNNYTTTTTKVYPQTEVLGEADGVLTSTYNPQPQTSDPKLPDNYYKKASYSGVSLVDGLKSVGVYSIGGKKVDDVSSRTELAAANGIVGYTGTNAQNTQLLNKLKSGTLVKG